MKDPAIKVKNIAKKYSIAKGREYHDTLRDQIMYSMKSIFRWNGRSKQGENTFWALKDISFEIGRGEIVGIVGHNGAGKSTLLKILSRITEPTQGVAEIFGRVGSLLEVGTGFHSELTGRENIYLSGAIIGMKKREIRRHFDAIVDFSEVERFLDIPVKRYSSGMYVRLAFAVAAHLEPEILLVDEVLSVGDASFQKKCIGRMGKAAQTGRTVIFISHNMTAINSLCDRVIWLKNGKIVEDGPSTQVVKNYLMESVENNSLSEEVWNDISKAPGNDMVRLHRLRIRRQDKHPSDPLTMQTPFIVEVEYWNLAHDAHLHVTLHLYTAEGLIAFTTGSLLDPVWRNRPMPTGLFKSVCYFPGDLLNSGQHRFIVLFVRNMNSVIYKHESRVTCDILDLQEREFSYFGREPGIVQPILKWSTEYLGKDSGSLIMVNEDQSSFGSKDS